MTQDQRLLNGFESPQAQRRKKKGSSVFTIVGVLLLVLGLACLGFIGYQYFGTNVVAQKSFDEKKETLRNDWGSAPAPQGQGQQLGGTAAVEPLKHDPGQPVALLRIPKFGADYEVPVMSGTDLGTLSKGVGWYEGSVGPGEIGNFALAGHRVTHGEPFARILELAKGDQVIVETRGQVFTYVMDTSPADLTVDDKQVWVVDPVPGKPRDTVPTKELLTLTTCQDLFHSPDRSVGFGHLQSVDNK